MSVADLLRVPGRLCHTPTDLAAAFPHGGTSLGEHARVTLVREDGHEPGLIRAPEHGGMIADVVWPGDGWVLEATSREWNAAALAAAFPTYKVGAYGGPILELDVDSSVRPGSLLGDLARVLVFSPDALDAHPMIVVRRAVPLIDPGTAIAMRGSEPFEYRLRWLCTPDANGKVIAQGLRREITL